MQKTWKTIDHATAEHPLFSFIHRYHDLFFAVTMIILAARHDEECIDDYPACIRSFDDSSTSAAFRCLCDHPPVLDMCGPARQPRLYEE